MKKKVTGKDLTKEAPRSPRIRVGGYAILGRTIDKCRALVAGNIGEYHFDCPLDNMVFGFKGVKGDDFKAQIEQGAGDQEIVEWLNQAGEEKTPEEIKRWADEVEASSLYNHPEKQEFFSEEVRKLGLDPEKTTTFEWLEVDDRMSLPRASAAMKSASPEDDGKPTRRKAQKSNRAEPRCVHQRVEESPLRPFHLSIYVLISGGGSSSVMPASNPRRSLLWRRP